MGLGDQFTKKQLAIGAGIALLAGMAGAFALDSNYKNQRLGECNSGDLNACQELPESFQPRITNREHLALPVISAANKCIENPWYCKKLKGLDQGLLPLDLKAKLDTKLEKRAAEKKKAEAEIAAAEKKRADLKKKEEAERAERATWGDWRYFTRTDDATGKPYKLAELDAENNFNLSSPYDGLQRAELTLRAHPRWGFDAIVGIDRGQILCGSYSNTTVLVRFDDGPAVPYSCGEPADHSSEYVFIRNAKQFEAGMKRANMAYITIRLYQGGSQTMKFKVKGYDSGKV